MDGLTGVFRLSLDPVSLLFESSQLLAFSLAQLQQVPARSQEENTTQRHRFIFITSSGLEIN
jgi:hypothetical protein